MDYIGEFIWEMVRQQKSETTISSYTNDLRMFSRWFRETNKCELDPRKLTPVDIAGYRSYLINVKKRKPAYINHQLSVIRSFCDFLKARGLIENNPAEEISPVKQERTPPRALSDAEKNRLLREVYSYDRNGNLDYRAIAIFEILLNTGIRIGELAAVELDDIQISQRKGRLIIRSGKGGKYREVPLNKDARKAITEYLNVRPEVDHNFLLVGQRKNPLTPNGIWRIVKNYLKRAGLDGATPHTLRHTFATNLLRKHGEDLVTVGRLLGHENINTTAIYTEPTQDDLEKAVSKLEKW